MKNSRKPWMDASGERQVEAPDARALFFDGHYNDQVRKALLGIDDPAQRLYAEFDLADQHESLNPIDVIRRLLNHIAALESED